MATHKTSWLSDWSWAANSMNGSGKEILNDMSCRSFLVLGCDIFFHQVWMENEWSMVAHESMRSNFAQGTTQMLQGLPTNPGTRTSVDGSIRLLPQTAAHWQTPWQQTTKDSRLTAKTLSPNKFAIYDFWTHQTVSNFIHPKCFCIFQQTLNGKSITHRSKLTVLLTHRGPRGKSLQRKWNFSSRVRSTQIMNDFDISDFFTAQYSRLQQTIAFIRNVGDKANNYCKQTDPSRCLPVRLRHHKRWQTNYNLPINDWQIDWIERSTSWPDWSQQQLVNFQAIDSQTNDPVSLSLMINDRINLRKKCCPWINDNLCICLPTYTSIHWCHVGLLYSKRSKTTDGDVSKWGGCCWFQKGTRVLSIQRFSLFRIDTYPHSYLNGFRFHPELAASMPGRWKRWNPEHWQR